MTNMTIIASMIAVIMQTIINDIDVDSKYMDFLDDFEVIESYIESLSRDHPIRKNWSSLYNEICKTRGDLYNLRDKMQDFIDTLQDTPQYKLFYT